MAAYNAARHWGKCYIDSSMAHFEAGMKGGPISHGFAFGRESFTPGYTATSVGKMTRGFGSSLLSAVQGLTRGPLKTSPFSKVVLVENSLHLA